MTVGSRSGFHPSKEGFKGNKGKITDPYVTVFPSLKGRFQRASDRLDVARRGLVSIPQRKVSKPNRSASISGGRVVSIPQRKVSKAAERRIDRHSARSFHPSKEGFKAAGNGRDSGELRVSIPQRKVSKRAPESPWPSGPGGFHPSKEGFKGFVQCSPDGERHWFPSLKGRFQSISRRSARYSAWLVSIPQRKVSKGPQRDLLLLPVHRFHPSKEGFKVTPVIRKTSDLTVSIPQRKVSKMDCQSSMPQPYSVSIPQRKVSKPGPSWTIFWTGNSFHPSKEGFKEPRQIPDDFAAGMS